MMSNPEPLTSVGGFFAILQRLFPFDTSVIQVVQLQMILRTHLNETWN